jgi:hypothetical protein
MSTKRQVAEDIISICGGMLMQMGKKVGDGRLADTRLEVMLAAIVRTVNSANAIKLLYTERPYSEEMNTLLRPLVELIVNACYIQIASDAEVECYRTYDTVMLEKSIRLAEEIVPTGLSGVTPENRKLFAEHIKTINQTFAGVMSTTSWTKLDLTSRGSAIDKHTGLTNCHFLTKVVYRIGHTYTHATYGSLENTIDTFKTGQFSSNTVIDEADLALYGTSQALRSFAEIVIVLNNDQSYGEELKCVRALQSAYLNLC